MLLPAERHLRPWSGNQLARGLAINRGTKVHAWGVTRARSPQPAHGLAIIWEQKFTSGCDSGPIHFGGIFGRINTDRHPITFVECPSASQTTRIRAWGPQQHKRMGLHGIAPDPQGRAPDGHKEFYVCTWRNKRRNDEQACNILGWALREAQRKMREELADDSPRSLPSYETDV